MAKPKRPKPDYLTSLQILSVCFFYIICVASCVILICKFIFVYNVIRSVGMVTYMEFIFELCCKDNENINVCN